MLAISFLILSIRDYGKNEKEKKKIWIVEKTKREGKWKIVIQARFLLGPYVSYIYNRQSLKVNWILERFCSVFLLRNSYFEADSLRREDCVGFRWILVLWSVGCLKDTQSGWWLIKNTMNRFHSASTEISLLFLEIFFKIKRVKRILCSSSSPRESLGSLNWFRTLNSR